MAVNLDDPKLETKLKVWDFKLKVFTSLMLIVTVVIGVASYISQRRVLIRQNQQYEEQKKKEFNSTVEQNKRYEEQKTKEFNSTIYKARLDLYIEATDAAAKFSYSTTSKEASEAAVNFWRIYDGKLSILENQDVVEAMIDYGKFLREWQKCRLVPVPPVFRELTYLLSQSCRKSLAVVFTGEFTGETKPLDYAADQPALLPTNDEGAMSARAKDVCAGARKKPQRPVSPAPPSMQDSDSGSDQKHRRLPGRRSSRKP